MKGKLTTFANTSTFLEIINFSGLWGAVYLKKQTFPH